MPFSTKPVDLSPESSRLLDIALTKLWLEHVAMGAELSGAGASVRSDLWRMVERLDHLQTPRRTKKSQLPEKLLMAHKYRVGERVVFHAPRRTAGPSLFTVLRLLPAEGQEFTYRIKSPEGGVERIAKERELTSLKAETT